ncbi:hypothetical protein ACIQOU_27625 [Streptomyces sp. NPDC091279]|uniref:hypothetical protein n=1 Tax=unclassified Streptomyces TaxID=2593676 RepID=UPI00380E17A3
MNILNVVLGALCLLVTFVIAARSTGRSDRLLWAAAGVLVLGGVLVPSLLHAAGARLLCVVLSLAALLLLLRRQHQRN